MREVCDTADCKQPAVVEVNGVAACGTHLDAAMAGVMAPVKDMLARFEEARDAHL